MILSFICTVTASLSSSVLNPQDGHGNGAPLVLPAPPELLVKFGLRAGVLQQLAVVPRFPVTVDISGRAHEIMLTEYDVRSPDCQLLVERHGVVYQEPLPPSVTYRGSVVGLAGSAVAASIVGESLTAYIRMADGRSWTVEPAAPADPSIGPSWHIVYEDGAVIGGAGRCGVVARGMHAMPQPSGSPDSQTVCQLACEADFPYFQQNSSHVGFTQNAITSLVNAVDLVYQTDVQIRYQITTIYVHSTPDPYTSNDPATLLSQFRSRWNTSMSGTKRDTAHLFTGRVLTTYIGFANLGVICNTSNAYALSQPSGAGSQALRRALVAHELGHNWSATHCNSPEGCSTPAQAPGCYIMCSNIGCCGGSTSLLGALAVSQIQSFRNTISCVATTAPDECSNASPVSIGINGLFSNVAATTSTQPWSCTSATNDVWFSHTTSGAGQYTFSTCTSSRSFDTVLEVLSGACGGLTSIACNDDSCGYGSSVTANIAAGQALWIRVGGYPSLIPEIGDFDLVVSYVPAPYTVSGTVTAAASGLTGVTMNYTNPAGSVITQAGGSYSITVNYGWMGTVTPSLAGYSFTPPQISYSAPVTQNLSGQNYAAVPSVLTVSGTLTSSGVGLGGVTLTGFPGAVVTQANGSYTATVSYGWTGTVTPSLAGYAFTPPQISYSAPVTQNLSGQNYTAVPSVLTVSGTVTSSGVGLGGVTLTGFAGAVVTQANGNYTATVSYGWTGTVTPSLAGYAFTPPQISYSAPVTQNLSGQNYTALLAPLTVSGIVSKLGVGIGGVSLVGFPTGVVVTQSNGSYAAAVPNGWTGGVTPWLTGHSFTPPSIVYTTPLTQHVTNQDYMAYNALGTVLVSPRALTTIEGNNSDQAPLGASGSRRFQMVLGPDDMVQFAPGTLISGLRFRVNGPSPSVANQTVGNYEIRMSQSANVAGALNLTFANNRGADEVVVRSGPLTINLGEYPSGGNPNGFGPSIEFQTPYRYIGGSLLIEIAHDGFVAGGTLADGEYPATTERQAVYASSFSAVFANLGSFSSAPVVQLRACTSKAVSPAHLAASEGNNGDQAPLGYSGQRRFQMVLGATELGAIQVGDHIWGIKFRANMGAGVLAPQAVANYEVRLSQSAVPPGSLNLAFASNRGPDELVVRTGPLVVLVGDYRNIGAPTTFGELIRFDQPYQYKGGPLLVEIAHDGFPAGGILADSEYPATTARQAVYGSSYTSTTGDLGVFATAPVMNIVFDGAPCRLAGYWVFGAGCIGTNGVPSNTASAAPQIGTTFAISFGNLPAPELALVLFGFNNTMSGLGPLPLNLSVIGAPGCFVRVSPDITAFQSGAFGSTHYSLIVPNTYGLVGLSIFTQALVLDPPINALGACISDSAVCLIGL